MRVPGSLRVASWPDSWKGQGWGYGGWSDDIKVVFGYNSKVFVGYIPKKSPKRPDLGPKYKKFFRYPKTAFLPPETAP